MGDQQKPPSQRLPHLFDISTSVVLILAGAAIAVWTTGVMGWLLFFR